MANVPTKKLKVAGKFGSYGEPGTTFTPDVSEEGMLSWTNDGGLENPAPVNVKGVRGEPGVYVGTETPTDDSAMVWIDPEGVTYGAGTGLILRTIVEITESSAGFELTKIAGENFCYRRMRIALKSVTASTTDASSNTWLTININGQGHQGSQYAVAKNGTKYSRWDIECVPIDEKKAVCALNYSASAVQGNFDVHLADSWFQVNGSGVTKLRFVMGDTYTTFEPGTIIYVFGEE